MASKKLVVVGGAGALGRGIGAFFARAGAWQELSVDFGAGAAGASFVLERGSSLAQAPRVLEHVRSTCVAPGAASCWTWELVIGLHERAVWAYGAVSDKWTPSCARQAAGPAGASRTRTRSPRWRRCTR